VREGTYLGIIVPVARRSPILNFGINVLCVLLQEEDEMEHISFTLEVIKLSSTTGYV